MTQDYEIINADCLRAMQEMPDGYVDAIVTDPPYGLVFMGANWDRNVPSMSYWSECLRVAKSGAHLLCFGGTRTFHRLMCAIEDAGWEIRDTIMWVYGSGFPKSMDVGKAIDKALGAKREKVPNPLARQQTAQHGTVALNDKNAVEYIYPEPVTDQARQWDGWGTCLKPAWEPIIVARKPLDGTVANNVMEHGTGAINVDGCRVPTNDRISGGMYGAGAAFDSPWMHDEKAQAEFMERKKSNYRKSETMGRFPANLVHDGSQEVLSMFPETNPSRKGRPRSGMSGTGWGMTHTGAEYDDAGSAARFFYCAKASRKDRGEGNDHPTVKPNALMRWLVRLVCPQGGIVLDPFMGSGSTGVACVQEGMRFVGIDMDEHYCDIANARISKETDNVFCENQ